MSRNIQLFQNYLIKLIHTGEYNIVVNFTTFLAIKLLTVLLINNNKVYYPPVVGIENKF